jgi:hypothetical protein
VPRAFEQLKADAIRLQLAKQHQHQQLKERGVIKHKHRARRSLEAKATNQSQWQIVNVMSAEIVDAADGW